MMGITIGAIEETNNSHLDGQEIICLRKYMKDEK